MTIVRSGFGKTGVLAAIIAAGLLSAGSASAQQQRGLLDNLFSRGDSSQQQGEDNAKAEASEMSVRIDRLQNQVRQLTGQIEQLQYRNQQLEQQLARQNSGVPPQQAGLPPTQTQTPVASATPMQPAPSTSGKRSDAFDPNQNPNAPGVPRALGGGAVVSAPPMQQAPMQQAPMQQAPMQNDIPVGAAGSAAPGAPLDLSKLAGGATANATPVGVAPSSIPAGNQLPPPQGTQLATLPPSKSPRDEYDLAYGYVLHKDYALAEQAFKDFLRKNGGDKLAPDAHYWLGESLFERKRYQDAADSYLVVVRNYEHSEKAPDALLRLGQSLAALGQKEMACASLGEVSRKYPQAAASVKRSVTAEQKKTHC